MGDFLPEGRFRRFDLANPIVQFVVVPGWVHLAIVVVCDCPVRLQHQAFHLFGSQMQQAFCGDAVTDFGRQVGESMEELLGCGLVEQWAYEGLYDLRNEREVEQVRVYIENRFMEKGVLEFGWEEVDDA